MSTTISRGEAAPGQTPPAPRSPETPPAPPSLGATLAGVGLVLLTLAGWTIAPLMVKHFVGEFDAWTQNGWRYGFSAALWLPYLIRQHRRGLPAGYWRGVAIVSLANVIGQTMFAWSFYFTTPTMITFGLRIQVIAVVIMAALVFPAERPVIRHPWFIAGLVAVAGGAVMTAVLASPDAPDPAPMSATTSATGPGDQAAAPISIITAAPRPVLGFALAVGAGVFFAAYAVAVRRYMANVGSLTAFAGICQVTAALLLILMLALGGTGATDSAFAAAAPVGAPADMPASASAWDGGLAPLRLADHDPANFALFLASAVIGIAIAHVFYYMAIVRLGVATSTGVVQIQPFAVALPSFLLFGEQLNLWQWLGGTLAVVGAILIVLIQRRVTTRQHARRAAEPRGPAPRDGEAIPVDAGAVYEPDDPRS